MRTIVEHLGENNREYELVMNDMPENPTGYFNDVMVGGYENWTWVGPGTAERNNYPHKDFVQVVD